jgi:TRAP-type uncharacterized transport system substrate-binding protein
MLKSLNPLQKLLVYGLLVVALIAAIFWLSSRYNPAPPRSITFSAGSAGGAYDAFAKAYATDLAKQGVNVTVLPSAGSLENLKNLLGSAQTDSQASAAPKADVALVQSGVTSPEQLAALQGIAAVAYEPVWVFTKQGMKAAPSTLPELVKLNLALPKQGSGARVTLEGLLKAAQLTLNPAWQEYNPLDAVKALDAGQVDAVFVVASIQAPVVQTLLNSPHTLMSFSHALAIARKLPAYSVVTLPRGSINQAVDKPNVDIQLIATQAILVSKQDLHPALAYILLDAATRIHPAGSELQPVGQFPSAKVAEFTLADETTRYFKDGKPWLERVLPFWFANFIARLLLIVIPLAAVVFPIAKLWPEIEAFISKRALKPHYEALHCLEHTFFNLPAEQQSATKEHHLKQLHALNIAASQAKVPSDHYKDRYALQQNIAVVRGRVEHV